MNTNNTHNTATAANAATAVTAPTLTNDIWDTTPLSLTIDALNINDEALPTNKSREHNKSFIKINRHNKKNKKHSPRHYGKNGNNKVKNYGGIKNSDKKETDQNNYVNIKD